ncbi:MAG: thiamine phosphate synthase [Betaproteobacteria bacterium]|nr:thiamine phosphate synthase [Betaproteobacteria bacterium]
MNILDQAQSIAQRHAALRIGQAPDLQAASRGLAGSEPFQVGWLASRLLGFLEHDAQCIAAAWQAQTLRTGYFKLDAWPCEPEDFGMSLKHPKPFPPCPSQLGLYAVLPDAEWVSRLVDLGVPTVQLRFKSDDPRAVHREVQAAVKAVQGSQSLLFINDHWQAAIDAGAYGVHLGQEDMQLAPLAHIHASGLRLGLSSHGYAEMLLAAQHGPSYLALGAVFPTTLKRMATAPQGLGRLNMYAKLMRHLPLVAIGGIDLHSLPAVMQCGVGSAAFVRAITASEDLATSVQQLQACMSRRA